MYLEQLEDCNTEIFFFNLLYTFLAHYNNIIKF